MSDPYAFEDDEAELEPLEEDDEEIELEDEAEADDDDPWAKTSSGDDEV